MTTVSLLPGYPLILEVCQVCEDRLCHKVIAGLGGTAVVSAPTPAGSAKGIAVAGKLEVNHRVAANDDTAGLAVGFPSLLQHVNLAALAAG